MGARSLHPQARASGQEVGRALLKPSRRRLVGLALPALASGAGLGCWFPIFSSGHTEACGQRTWAE